MSPRRIPRTIGRYTVVDELGRGGMGYVYRAKDPTIDRLVAVKLLTVFGEDELHGRFLQEARSAGSLKHPNIVTIYDFGEEDGQPFIVMELVEGLTLQECIRKGPDLGLDRKLQLLESLADGLDYAHRRGIVHRDIKPGNLKIDSEGHLKILDFGIARIADLGVTMTGAVMGTPNYMSPEQVDGRRVDLRSDIYAVGLVMYELLTGRQVFSGDSAHQVMHAIATAERVPLDDTAIDPPLFAIVLKATQHDPAQRYQHLSAMRADLQAYRVGSTPQSGEAIQPTIQIKRSGADTSTRESLTPRRLDRDSLERRRAERIDTLLQQAQRALDGGLPAEAVDACEQAMMLDAAEPRVLAMLDAAQSAVLVDRVRVRLAEAQQKLDADDLNGASAIVAEAIAAAPGLPDALRLRAVIENSRKARERAAIAAIEEQDRRFEEGGRTEALDALERIRPAHPLIDAAVSRLRAEAAEHDRMAREAEQQRLAAEGAERQRRIEEERLAAEAAERQRVLAQQRLAAEAAERERRLEEERVAAEAVERERLLEQQRLADAAEAQRQVAGEEAKTLYLPRPQESLPGTEQVGEPPADSSTIEPAVTQSSETASTTRRWRWALTVATAAGVLLTAWLLWPTPASRLDETAARHEERTPSAGSAALQSLTINAMPWARVRVTPTSGAQQPVERTTPFVVALPPGQYRLEFQNPVFGSGSQSLVVGPGGPSSVSLTLPGADVDKIVAAVLGPQQ